MKRKNAKDSLCDRLLSHQKFRGVCGGRGKSPLKLRQTDRRHVAIGCPFSLCAASGNFIRKRSTNNHGIAICNVADGGGAAFSLYSRSLFQKNVVALRLIRDGVFQPRGFQRMVLFRQRYVGAADRFSLGFGSAFGQGHR
jgi:hypothetical protein